MSSIPNTFAIGPVASSSNLYGPFEIWEKSPALATYRFGPDDLFPQVYSNFSLSVRPATKASPVVKHRVKLSIPFLEWKNKDTGVTIVRSCGQPTELPWELTGKVARVATLDLTLTTPDTMTHQERTECAETLVALLGNQDIRNPFTAASPLI